MLLKLDIAISKSKSQLPLNSNRYSFFYIYKKNIHKKNYASLKSPVIFYETTLNLDNNLLSFCLQKILIYTITITGDTMKNINKKIIMPIIAFIFLTSMIVIKVASPSYATEVISDNITTEIKDAYIIDDNGRVDFSANDNNNTANLSTFETSGKQYDVKINFSFAHALEEKKL